MIITVENKDFIFESLNNSLCKKNNLDHLIYYINDKFFCSFDIENIKDLIKYSLYLNNIILNKNNLDEIIENYFEMINLYDDVYFYGMLINILIVYSKSNKLLFAVVLNKFKNLIKDVEKKDINYNILHFFINNFIRFEIRNLQINTTNIYCFQDIIFDYYLS